MSPEGVGDRLAVLYGDIQATAMRDAPICNEALVVEAVGFRDFAGYVLGVVVTPWFLNLIVAESQQIGRPAIPSSALRLRFPAGDVDFIVSELRGFGRIASCSLFSPMSGFADHQAARAAAEAALCALLDAHLHEPPAAPQSTPREGLDRRALFGGWRSPPRSGKGAL